MSNNLVLNPGFETGNLDDWTVSDPQPENPDIGVDSQPLDVNSGSYGVFAGNETSTLSQTIATTPGHTYTVSFDLDVYASTAYDGGFDATFGGQTVLKLVEPAETDSFVKYTETIEATSANSQLEFTFTDPGGYFGFDDVSVTDNAACFVRGTRLMASRGEIAIENLRIGDSLLTHSGAERQVRWVGHRAIDARRHREPAAVWPIRIQSGAFAEQRPSRDLWVSPGHAVYFEGVLIQAEKLVNGTSVLQMPLDRVEYWHVELDAHDIVLAEGLPSESYLDTGNRAAFANGCASVEAHPDFRAKHWSETCVPLVFDGDILRRARALLIARALELGHRITALDDAHILADGRRIEPVRITENRLAFMLPTAAAVELRSRTFVPAYIDAASSDTRALGLCVERLQIDGSDAALDGEPGFAEGWHALERRSNDRPMRWTQGRLPLPPGTRLVVMDLAGRGYYLEESAEPTATRVRFA